VGEVLETKIKGGLVDGQLPCAVAWDIARELTMKRIDVAGVVEALGIRIVQCQLGCFD